MAVPCINNNTDTGNRPCFFRPHSIPYPHAKCIAKHLPHLRPSQIKGLGPLGGRKHPGPQQLPECRPGRPDDPGPGLARHPQYLREWLDDGTDRAAPCRVQLDMDACFPPLLRWVLTSWEGTELTLALVVSAGGEQPSPATCPALSYRQDRSDPKIPDKGPGYAQPDAQGHDCEPRREPFHKFTGSESI